MAVCPVKTQISIHPIWSESSLCAQWVAKDPSFLHEDSEDSDQTGRMPRLIWVFAWRTLILLVLSCCGSIMIWISFFWPSLKYESNIACKVNLTPLWLSLNLQGIKCVNTLMRNYRKWNFVLSALNWALQISIFPRSRPENSLAYRIHLSN